ncbi:MAG: RsmB/NOP family class I SAM-dependent RNA methyltransferase [Pseudomonadota bacterium]
MRKPKGLSKLKPELTDLLPEDFKHREVFAARLLERLGEAAAEQILKHLAAPRSWLSFWFNPLRPSTTQALDDLRRAANAVPLASIEGLYITQARDAVTRSTLATHGQLYIQSAASYAAARALNPQPGEEVLDLAAAPGGKTIAMAAMMQNTGRLAAVEPVVRRFHRLQANLERCGVENVALYQRDGRGVGRAVPARFDRVLLDAPCSSEARINFADPQTYQHWQPRKVAEAQRKQHGLLASAYAALKPGGRLLYCTCSFALEENELVVAKLLKRSDAQLLVLPASDYAVPGLTDVPGRNLPAALQMTQRWLPDGAIEGFYMALIGKPAAPV